MPTTPSSPSATCRRTGRCRSRPPAMPICSRRRRAIGGPHSSPSGPMATISIIQGRRRSCCRWVEGRLAVIPEAWRGACSCRQAPGPAGAAVHTSADKRGLPCPHRGSTARRCCLDWMMLRNPRDRWWRLDGGDLVLTARTQGIGDTADHLIPQPPAAHRTPARRRRCSSRPPLTAIGRA